MVHIGVCIAAESVVHLERFPGTEYDNSCMETQRNVHALRSVRVGRN